MNLERRIAKLETSLSSSGVVTVLVYAGETLDQARERHLESGGADPITAALTVWIDKPIPRLH
jgi:hypothetical protein